MTAPPEDDQQEKTEVPYTSHRSNRRMGDQGSHQSMWLVSFTDVMALMLTFFVLLFAMSSPQQEDWEQFTQNIQKNFNRFEGAPLNRGPEDAVNINRINFTQALDLNYLKALIKNLLDEEPTLHAAKLIETRHGLIISLPQDLLFESGQAEVKSAANQALFTVAGTLGRIKNRVEIEGHTDPRPINGGAYSSNWELSLARAASVAAVLENVGYDKPVTIRGQSSGRFDDIPDSVPMNERLDLSRRVDIIIMEDDGRRMKFFDIGLP